MNKNVTSSEIETFFFVCFQFRCLMALGFSLQKNILPLFLGTLCNHIRKKTAEFSPFSSNFCSFTSSSCYHQPPLNVGPFTVKSKHLLFKPSVSFSSCPPSLFSHLTFNPLQPTDDSLHPFMSTCTIPNSFNKSHLV